MAPADLVRSTRAALGLSVEGFASAVHVTGRAVRRWEDGSRDVPGPVMVLAHLWTSGRLPKALVPTKERPDVAHPFSGSTAHIVER